MDRDRAYKEEDLMSLIKMFVASTGAATVSAEIDVPADGFITSVVLEAYVSDTTLVSEAGQQLHSELSFMATDTFDGGHDSRGVLLMCNPVGVILTSGGCHIGKTNYLTGVKIKVYAGERLYLHIKESAAAQSAAAYALVYIDDKDSARPAARRR